MGKKLVCGFKICKRKILKLPIDFGTKEDNKIKSVNYSNSIML